MAPVLVLYCKHVLVCYCVHVVHCSWGDLFWSVTWFLSINKHEDCSVLNCYTDQNPPKRLLNIWTFMYCTAQPPQSNTSQTKCCHQLFYSIYILRCTLKLNSSTDSSLRYFSFKTQHGLSQFFNNSSVRFPANENFRKKNNISQTFFSYFANVSSKFYVFCKNVFLEGKRKRWGILWKKICDSFICEKFRDLPIWLETLLKCLLNIKEKIYGNLKPQKFFLTLIRSIWWIAVHSVYWFIFKGTISVI